MLNRRSLIATLALVGLASPGAAQTTTDYPSRPVTLVVPFAAGGNTDVVARLVADKVGTLLGQRMIVDNRGGAGGAIGSTTVARAAPDGYTLLMGTVLTHAIGPNLSKAFAYDAVNDFEPVSLVAVVPNVLVANPGFGPRDPASFIAKLKAEGGKVNYGSPGVGSIGHLQAVWFNTLAGVDASHVPYRGTGPATQDLLSGNIQFMHDNLPPMLAQIQSGSVVPILVTTERRVTALPNVPTGVEAGFPDFLSYSWNMLLAPKGTPRPVVDRLHKAVVEALADPGLRGRMGDLNIEVVGSTPETSRDYLRTELAEWGPIVKASGATVN